jgi:hypothetical protein
VIWAPTVPTNCCDLSNVAPAVRLSSRASMLPDLLDTHHERLDGAVLPFTHTAHDRRATPRQLRCCTAAMHPPQAVWGPHARVHPGQVDDRGEGCVGMLLHSQSAAVGRCARLQPHQRRRRACPALTKPRLASHTPHALQEDEVLRHAVATHEGKNWKKIGGCGGAGGWAALHRNMAACVARRAATAV